MLKQNKLAQLYSYSINALPLISVPSTKDLGAVFTQYIQFNDQLDFIQTKKVSCFKII